MRFIKTVGNWGENNKKNPWKTCFYYSQKREIEQNEVIWIILVILYKATKSRNIWNNNWSNKTNNSLSFQFIVNRILEA